jgi:7-keto-8-aminopelargonate synthetase-like enzyme
VLPGENPFVPVAFQEEIELRRLCKTLLEEGIYINPVLRPAAAQNLLRISCTAVGNEKYKFLRAPPCVMANKRRN